MRPWLSPPAALGRLVVIGAAMAVLAGAKQVEELSPAERKKAIQKYLAAKTGRAATGNSLPKGEPWGWARQQYMAVPKQDPKLLAAWIAEHLLVADRRYLASKKLEERRKGLGIVQEAAKCASDRIKDHKLAVEIVEVYVLPSLDAADERSWKYLGKQNVLEAVAGVYAEAQDAAKFGQTLKRLIDNAPNRNTADAARFRLAQLLDREGKYEEALKHLKEIDPEEGIGNALNMIPKVEKKLRDKAAKEKKP